MTLKCYYCLAELHFIETDDDELPELLVCQDCQEEIQETLRKAREIHDKITKRIEQMT